MKGILLIVALLCLMGTVSATDYYLSPTGDDANDGLSIANAKYNLSNMDGLTEPGVTIYVLNGSYYDTGTFVIRTALNNGGNLTHGVQILAYNGSPEFHGTTSNPFIGIGSSGDSGLVENVTFDGISFRNYTKIMDVRKSGNFTMSNCTLYNVSESQDSAQLGGFGSQYITFNGNTIKGFIGYNSINFVLGSYFYIYDNIIKDVNNTANHGALQIGWNITNVEVYNNTMLRVPRSGGIIIYNGDDNRWSSDINIYDCDIYENSNGLGLINAYNISMYNITIDPRDTTLVSAHAVYLKGYPYYYLDQDLTKRTHNISLDNITFSNWSGPSVWSRVRVEGGDGITLSNITFTDKDDAVHDFWIRGYNSTLESTYPDSIKIQDTISSPYEVRLTTPVKVSINYTDNSVFDITSEGSYPEGNRTIAYTSEYSSNLFWKYSGADHRFEVTKYNITFTPVAGHGNNVTVNTDLVDDVSNITANVSEPTTVTMTFLVDNASNTYNFLVNNVWNTTEVSNSDAVVSFDYVFSSSTPTDFEITWNSTVGWSAGESIFVGHMVRISDDGSITQLGSPTQESINLTGLLGVVLV